jgi:hypothetical protein
MLFMYKWVKQRINYFPMYTVKIIGVATCFLVVACLQGRYD